MHHRRQREGRAAGREVPVRDVYSANSEGEAVSIKNAIVQVKVVTTVHCEDGTVLTLTKDGLGPAPANPSAGELLAVGKLGVTDGTLKSIGFPAPVEGLFNLLTLEQMDALSSEAKDKFVIFAIQSKLAAYLNEAFGKRENWQDEPKENS
jgi:hypothetical protein